MFTEYSSYFDGSGNKEMPVQVVSGFVSTANKWARFESEWNAILKDNGVSALHMTDYVAYRGEFANWRDSARRKQFQDALTACMRRHVNKLFSSGLVIEHYNAVNRIYRLDEFVGSPFAVCGHRSLVKLYRWADRKEVNPKHLLAFLKMAIKTREIFKNGPRVSRLSGVIANLGFWRKKRRFSFRPLIMQRGNIEPYFRMHSSRVSPSKMLGDF